MRQPHSKITREYPLASVLKTTGRLASVELKVSVFIELRGSGLSRTPTARLDMSKTRYDVSYTAPIAASPESVYRVIADYRDGHPRILPSAFRNMVVEKGGVGAGTQTRFEVHAFGQTQSIRHEVFEPEPGRVLVERDRDVASQTTFTVDPADGGSRVTIHSELLSRSGIGGVIERFLSRRFLLRLYREELANLEREARRAG